MTDMRALIDSLTQTETETIVEAELAAVTASPGAAFGAWSQQGMQPEQSVIFHAGALLGRQLRHVLERHPEFTFEESKGDHETKFTVKGDPDFLEALKRIVSKLTASENVVDEAETIDTHSSREPTDEENDEVLQTISMLVKTGHTSGHASLVSGARYSWALTGDKVVEDDEFAQEYVAGLIGEGYREGHNPRWTLAINIWGDRLEAELEEGHEELTYPDGEVYHTEYDAPGEGDRVQDKHGRTGTAQGNEPSKHGHEFSPEVYVEWDDEPGQIYPTTADDLTIIPHAAQGELDEDMTFGSDFDGITDTEVLGLDDAGADVGADYCYGSPTGEHHFIEGECVDCGQDESFEVDEQDVDQEFGETPGFNDEERIPR